MPLTDLEVKKIKYAREDGKPQRHYDANGMYLEILATGAKYWRMKYKRPNGKESRLAFGVYPTISLKEARTKRDEALELIRQGTDPSAKKKEEKLLSVLTQANTFEALAREWMEKQPPNIKSKRIMIRTKIRTSEVAMHARMTFTLDTQIVDLFKNIVPAKQRSQYVEEILRKALRRAEMEADYEAMANDPESQADGEFYKDFCGDIE